MSILSQGARRPHSHPAQQTEAEEAKIREAFAKFYYRYGWLGVYKEPEAKGYSRSFSGMLLLRPYHLAT